MNRHHVGEDGGAMRIECPHCRVSIDVVDEMPDSDVTCPSCGSRIGRSSTATLIRVPSAPPPEASTAPAQSESKKQMFGRFELQSLLGQGTFGTVWKALDTEDQRLVALKLLRSQTEIQPGQEAEARDARTRFEREARTLAKLEHPGIVRLYKFGVIDDRLYLASELIDGNNLKVLFKWMREKEEWYTFKQVAQLCGQVAEALHAAHAAGIVHRDLKPANILLDSHGCPHVADFGLAKRDDRAEYTMTQAQELLGTPVYMAPEQWENPHLVGPASDIYSLGAMLYEFLTGRVPFLGTTLEKLPLLREQVVRDDPIAPRKLRSDIPVDLETICLKCLEKDPAIRFASAQQLADELRRFVVGDPIEARPPTRIQLARRWCHRNPAVASLSVAVVFVLLTGTAVSSFFAFQSAARNRDLAASNRDLEKESKRANDQTYEAMANLKKVKIEKDRADANADDARRHLYSTRMNLVQRNWDSSQVALVLDLLETTRPHPGETDFRGFEWNYWDRLCHSSLLNLKGHTDGVSSVAFSTNGKRLASASWDGTVKVWDTTSGQETLALKGHKDRVMSVAFSPDGKRLASASLDATVKVWDATRGQETLTLKGHNERVMSVVFAPDGKRLASASSDETVKVWDATSGQETLTLKGHNDEVLSVAFSADGKRLASGSSDKTLKVWDATSGQELLTLEGHTNAVWCVVFSPDGKRLASASWDQTLKVWDTANGQEMLTLEGHTSYVNSVAFSADGKRLASASSDKTVKMWDATSGQETLTLKGHTSAVWSVVFSSGGTRLASASFDQVVKVWDATSGQEMPTLKGHTGAVTSVAFSADGERLVSASDDQTVKVWDATSGQVTLTLKGHSGAVWSVAASADGKRLASASGDHTVKIWDATSGYETLTLKGHIDAVYCVAFSPDGKRLASASADQTVKVWDAVSGQETLTLNAHTGDAASVAFSEDGKRLASASVSYITRRGRILGEVKLWDATSGQETLTLNAHIGGAASVAFSTDGKRLASASPDKTVKVWDVASGLEILTLKGHTGRVHSVAFSADGTRLASASDDDTVKVWDATSGLETLTLNGHTGGNVAFSADGKRLASASSDGTVKVWDARPWTPKLRAEREALSLIHFLRDHDKPQSEWLNAISSDQTLNEPVRQRALQFALEWK